MLTQPSKHTLITENSSSTCKQIHNCVNNPARANGLCRDLIISIHSLAMHTKASAKSDAKILISSTKPKPEAQSY